LYPNIQLKVGQVYLASKIKFDGNQNKPKYLPHLSKLGAPNFSNILIYNILRIKTSEISIKHFTLTDS